MRLKGIDLDSMIYRLLTLDTKAGGITSCISAKEIITLCQVARDHLLNQPSLLEISAPVKVCGDIHGQYSDLLKIFCCGWPPHTKYLFLGDYVDRGKQGLEVIVLLLAYKLRYPDNFFLLRGNHELLLTNCRYGFHQECQQRYGNFRLFKLFQQVFNSMPLCARIDNKIFCVHGGMLLSHFLYCFPTNKPTTLRESILGLSPKIWSWDQLRTIKRPVCPEEPGLLTDLLWSDPDPDIEGWRDSRRGTSYNFGEDVVKDFCKTMGVELVVRAHEVVVDGYEFCARRHLVTIFSIPFYLGEFDNEGASMMVDENLQCSFEVYRRVFRRSSFRTRGIVKVIHPDST